LLIHPTRLFADDSRTGSGPGRARRVETGQIAYNVKKQKPFERLERGLGRINPPSPCLAPPLMVPTYNKMWFLNLVLSY